MKAWMTKALELLKASGIIEPMSEQTIALKRQIRNLRQTRNLLLPRLLLGQLDFKRGEGK